MASSAPSGADRGNWDLGGAADDRRDAEPQDVDGVVMSCVFLKNRLGIAVYDAERGVLSVAEAAEHEKDLPVAPVLQLFKYQFRPTRIVAPSRGDERFIAALEATIDLGQGGESAGIDVEVLPSSDYSPGPAAARVANIMLPDMSDAMSMQERAQYISSIVNFDEIAMIRAAGGLLAYLTKNGLLNSLDEEGTPYSIRSLDNVTLDGIMTVDQHAHKALSVFESQPHPSFQGIGVKKEGFSLFGILSGGCASTPGRELLRQWLIRPVNSPDLIEDRLDTIEFLVDIRHKELRNSLHSSIKQLCDTERIVTRIQRLSASANDWGNLVKSCTAARQIWYQLERVSRRQDTPPLLKNVIEAWNPDVSTATTTYLQHHLSCRPNVTAVPVCCFRGRPLTQYATKSPVHLIYARAGRRDVL
jgi:DNA mismatch repair ATPase MutS